MALSIAPISAFKDNYIWLLRDETSGATAVVDPGQSEPVLKALQERGWRLDWILNTHHHWDHVSGNRALMRATGCRVAGAGADRSRIPGLDLPLAEGDRFQLGESVAEVMFTPGHTRGHICFWFVEDEALFCGDTLFLMGCGMLAEGDAPTLHASLTRLSALPASTRVFCAHEYTLANGKFALSIEPDNEQLRQRLDRDVSRRARGEPTVPGLIDEERATNPFLRCAHPQVATSLSMAGASPVAVFAALRKPKDQFKP